MKAPELVQEPLPVRQQAAFPPELVESALHDLSQDLLYDRMNPAYREALVRAALQLGFAAAERHAVRPASALAAHLGVNVVRSEEHSTAGGYELRAETDLRTRCVKLYLPALRRMATANNLSLPEAEEVALAHELFHYVEPTLDFSGLPRYELWRVGPWRRVVLPRRAREIAAHAFAMRVAGIDIYPGNL